MTLNELKELAILAAKGATPSTEFSVADVNASVLEGFQELAGSYNQFMKNRYDIFDIMIAAADEVVPKQVIDALGQFAEVQVVGEGVKASFKKRLGKNRAKKFLTQVGISGVYETFRLDSSVFELSTHAVGGAFELDFQRILDGAESLAECMEIITEGLVNAVFVEVQKALKASASSTVRPTKNKYSGAWNASEMVTLLSTVRAYGAPVIFAPPEFVAAMGADAIVPAGANFHGIYAEDDINSIHNTGFIKIFRGAPIVEIPQSFTDESNTTTWINPRMAYIMPAGNEKVVKVVLEGPTQIVSHENRDNSLEIDAWKKMGCAILCEYNWATYENTGITDTSADVYGF